MGNRGGAGGVSWSAALREIDDILDAWEAFVADPVNEAMPVTDVPEFPDGPLDADLVDVARDLKERSDRLQRQLGDLRDLTAVSLAALRRQRSAITTYRSAAPAISTPAAE